MEIPEKFKTEPSELKLFLERGNVRIYFEDGTFWEVEEPEKQVIRVSKSQLTVPDNFLHITANLYAEKMEKITFVCNIDITNLNP